MIRKFLSEGLVAVAALLGWVFLTAAFSRLFPDGRAVWMLSFGLLCFSLVGWQLLTTVVKKGLYTLMH